MEQFVVARALAIISRFDFLTTAPIKHLPSYPELPSIFPQLIMTFLQRSCQACVKARRRCNLATPCCARCSAKRIKCCYTNEPAPATADSRCTSIIKPTGEPRRLSHSPDHQSLSLLVVRGDLDTGLQMYIR